MQSHAKLFGHFLLIVVLGTLLLAAIPCDAQLGLGITPLRVELKGEPGKPLSGSLTLSNTAPVPVRVRATLDDFYIDDNAAPQFGDYPREYPYSCKQWLTVNPMEAEIANDKAVIVRYTIKVPAGIAPGSYNCAAEFVTLPTSKQMQATGLKMAVAVVPSFYVIIGDPKVDVEVKDVKLIPPSEKVPSWRLDSVFENHGTIRTRPTGTVTVEDQLHNAVETIDLAAVPLLPMRKQVYPVTFKTDLTKDRYTIRLRVDLGTGEIQEARIVTSNTE